MSNAKKLIRKGTLLNRRLLDSQVFVDRNRHVVNRSIHLIETLNLQCVHCFLSIKRNREVDTWPIIREVTERQKSVVVSATDFDHHTMTHFFYSENLMLKNDSFDIPTPINGTYADLSLVDVVLIPMLAGDKFGNRIGYGKGYYDQLLSEMTPKVVKVGLNLGPLFDRFPFCEPHDIPLEYVITPFETIKCYD